MSKSKMIYITCLAIIVIIIMNSIDSPNSEYKPSFEEIKKDEEKNNIPVNPEAQYVGSAELHSKLIQTFRESLLNTDYDMVFYTFEDQVVKHLYSTDEEIKEETLKEGFRSDELHGNEHKDLHPRMHETINELTKNQTLTNIEIQNVNSEGTTYKLLFVYSAFKIPVELKVNPESHLISTSPEVIINQINKK
jgi:hypothetical protein